MLTSDAISPALYDAAMDYAALGYSVIPVFGNLVPARAKAAATDWAHFQRQHPSDVDLKRWFHMYTVGGIAIITGHISRLLILDFDQIDIHHQFVAAFPHLCDTYVVTSAQRRLPHYYYRLPDGMEVTSRKIVGLDLLAEGRYVIAPPTQIAGRHYTVTQDRAPLSLSVDDVTALVAFMDNLTRRDDNVTRGTLSPTISSSPFSATPEKDASRGILAPGSSRSANRLNDVSRAPQTSSENTIAQADTVTQGTLSARLASVASAALNTLRQAAKEIIADPQESESYGYVGEMTLAEVSNRLGYNSVGKMMVVDTLTPDSYGRVGEIKVADAASDSFGHKSEITHTHESRNHSAKGHYTVTAGTLSLGMSSLQMAHNVTRGTLSPERLVQQYQQMACQIGRNEALFRMGVRARDFGWSQAEVECTLTSPHVMQVAPGDHMPETPRQRMQEAHRTIASVFKRPARKIQYSETQLGLPVSVREALLKLKQMPLLRVLDGLILKGIAAGARLTEKFITSILENIVGRHSVLRALKAMLPDGSAVFAPSPRTPTHTDVATEVTLFPGQKMLFVGVTESNKIRRGRPEQAYAMPSVLYLCRALGVSYTPSDPMRAEDLKSTRRTRQAIHRELLRRRPGLYSRALLARRLGVSVRSVQRYHRSAGVRVRAAYRQREIFWETLNCIPEKDDQPAHSAFLQDDIGKRYPLDMSLAKWLLTRNKRVFLMYQLPNHYSVMPENDAALSLDEPQMSPREWAILRLVAAAEQAETTDAGVQIAACSHRDLSQAMSEKVASVKGARGVQIAASTAQNPQGSYHDESYNTGLIQRSSPNISQESTVDTTIPQGLPNDASWLYTPSVSTRMMGAPSISPVPADALLFTPKPIRSRGPVALSEQAYREPLTSLDVERAAQRLYDVLRRRCTEKLGYMTLAKARQLLDQFGIGAVKRATHLLETRGNVQNPAGFLISVLRSNARLAGVLA